MAKIKVIYDEIMAHMNKEGSGYQTCYVGITSDIERRLFGEHNVPREDAWYIYRKADSEEDARALEEYILKTHNTDGDVGGGNHESQYIYAYKKIKGTTKE